MPHGGRTRKPNRIKILNLRRLSLSEALGLRRLPRIPFNNIITPRVRRGLRSHEVLAGIVWEHRRLDRRPASARPPHGLRSHELLANLTSQTSRGNLCATTRDLSLHGKPQATESEPTSTSNLTLAGMTLCEVSGGKQKKTTHNKGQAETCTRLIQPCAGDVSLFMWTIL